MTLIDSNGSNDASVKKGLLEKKSLINALLLSISCYLFVQKIRYLVLCSPPQGDVSFSSPAFMFYQLYLNDKMLSPFNVLHLKILQQHKLMNLGCDPKLLS